MAEEQELVELTPEQWIEKINEEAQAISDELSTLFGCEVEPAVFVVESLKDAAVAYIRKPDALQTMKLIRSLGEQGLDNGMVFIAQAQLIRQSDVEAKGVKGASSDPRFIDANGKYDLHYSEINAGLLMRMQRVIGFAKDQFKKK